MEKQILFAVVFLITTITTPLTVQAEGMRRYAEAAVGMLHTASRTQSFPGYFWEQLSNETIETSRLPTQAAIVDTFIAHVKTNDATAMFWLANAYNSGKLLPKKTNEAIKWYEAAASHGSAQAAGALTWLYKSGSDIPLDYKAAYRWTREAARLGEPNAQIEQIVFSKYPSTTTFASLIADLTRLADAGDADAQYARCLMENHHIGMVGDRIRARDFCSRAAAQGHLPAQTLYALLLSDLGEYSPETMSGLLAAATRGWPEAQFAYATASTERKRKDTSREKYPGSREYDPTEYGWMEKAADQDYAPAQMMLCAWAVTSDIGDLDYENARRGYKWCYVVEAVPYYRERVAAEKYYALIQSPGRHFRPFPPDEAAAAEVAAKVWRTGHAAAPSPAE